MTYAEWCVQNHCSHAHCPQGCWHPQPFLYQGRLFCGQCEALAGLLTEMAPCACDGTPASERCMDALQPWLLVQDGPQRPV